MEHHRNGSRYQVLALSSALGVGVTDLRMDATLLGRMRPPRLAGLTVGINAFAGP